MLRAKVEVAKENAKFICLNDKVSSDFALRNHRSLIPSMFLPNEPIQPNEPIG